MTPAGTARDPGELYREAKPFLDSARLYFEAEVRKLISGKVSDQYVTGRVKTARSLIRKLREKPGHPRSWSSITDKVGVRVICSTQADCKEVDYLIRASSLRLVKRKVMRGKPEELFYPGTHLIVEADTVVDHEGNAIPCEIQVRTRAQDAWSVVSHKLLYKGVITPPKRMQRVIKRLTVVVEMFDEDVQRMFVQRRRLRMYNTAIALEYIDRQYENLTGEPAEGFPNLAIMTILLNAYSKEELGNFEHLLEEFCKREKVRVSELIVSHGPSSQDYVDSRDWLYSQPEILSVLERASTRPYLLLNAVQETDLEDVVRKSCISAGIVLPVS